MPSNVNEALNPYNIVNLPTGAPAIEGDINLKKEWFKCCFFRSRYIK